MSMSRMKRRNQEDTVGIESEFEVECMRPFAAYQTSRGPFDSVGCYFRALTERASYFI
ncbi:hypothetical protein [Paenibacillus apiarius]|uniref:Uncharacterized protein n=1 Tax=Paenibacillus apiarius TaxID=46240 RepID=A0ABT4DMN6_9BACL|nr:hypothetical protein [Paenibacillus apiarius]MCY9514604.1 hypothetical protein [Paenibacillus apiarius]MCY9518594.1 hypothetical protein [Paenibacillus apiarius]MCY9552682.1 hypothetical protein [Paenibacillus apiarius]MCY9556990.1 hypothetical protein [Paenibacillus apiarius]MCY9686057.1 hypothetical protein [Paenibacillus apiarius]